MMLRTSSDGGSTWGNERTCSAGRVGQYGDGLMSQPLSPIPNDADVLDGTKISRRWYLWLYEVWLRIRSNVTLVGNALALTAQSASVVARTLYTVTQTGDYRVSYYIWVTTLATTSYSLTVTLGWRHGGVTKSQAFAALTGAPGTLATGFQTGTLPLVRADSGTVITVDIAYVSVGATAMVFASQATLQTGAANHAADVQDQAAQRAEAFQRQQAENEWLNSQNTQRANYDQSKARYGSIAGLAAENGLNLGGMPDYAAGIDPHYDTGATPAPGSIAAATPGANAPAASGTAGAAEMKALLDGGLDPQQAVQQFNQKYGRSTGNEAVYYDPSQHGGVATIGLPDAYLAKPGASWDITQRSGGVGTTSAPGAAPTYTPPTPYTPPPAFSYADFKGPTADDVLNDPGYQFERDQGLSAIGANRAAAGTLNTGGTLKDYVGFANNLASTHFTMSITAI
jgi:hypothetical protein